MTNPKALWSRRQEKQTQNGGAGYANHRKLDDESRYVRQTVRKKSAVEFGSSDKNRQPAQSKNHYRIGGPRMESFYVMKCPVELLSPRNPRILPESFQKIRDVLASAPCPSPLLFIEISHGVPKCWRHICVHRHRIQDRHHAPVAIIVQKTLPKDL